MSRAARRRGVPSKTQAKSNRRTWILYGSLAVVVIGLIVAVAISSSTPTPQAAPTPVKLTIGQPAPEFAVTTNAGPFDLAKSLGRPVFLELFATWCPHCQRETVILNKIFDDYKDRVTFVAVSASPLGTDEKTSATQADVTNFVQQFSVRYPVAFDPDLAVAKKYMQGGYPGMIIISKSGLIHTLVSGEAPEQQLRASLEKVLSSVS